MRQIRDIAEIMVAIKNTDDMASFLDEILTDNEKRDIVIRWELMERLYDGMPQRAIASDLGISLCRITRGARILRSDSSIIRRILEGERNP